MADPSVDHRDDVQQLMVHQPVAHLTKILNTNEAILELDSIESDALVAKSKLILCLKSIENDAGGQIKARLVAM